MHGRRKNTGFTLIEILAVLVLIAILSTFVLGFFNGVFDQYRMGEGMAKLSTRGQVVVEQFTRYLRKAVPNSVRISPTGHCVEFMPTSLAVPYLSDVPTASNGASATTIIPVSIAQAPSPAPPYAVVGPGNQSEVYQSGEPSARANVSAVSSTAVTLSPAHRFLNNSVSSRLYLGEAPKVYCVTSNELRLHEGYTFVTASFAGPPSNGTTALVASGTANNGANPIFTIDLDTQSGYSIVKMELVLSERDWSLPIEHSVVIRNAP